MISSDSMMDQRVAKERKYTRQKIRYHDMTKNLR